MNDSGTSTSWPNRRAERRASDCGGGAQRPAPVRGLREELCHSGKVLASFRPPPLKRGYAARACVQEWTTMATRSTDSVRTSPSGHGAEENLSRGLKNRHLQLIAIDGLRCR